MDMNNVMHIKFLVNRFFIVYMSFVSSTAFKLHESWVEELIAHERISRLSNLKVMK